MTRFDNHSGFPERCCTAALLFSFVLACGYFAATLGEAPPAAAAALAVNPVN